MQKSVLITGASKGIGEACALYFAKQGWRVFAGYRSKRDGYRLKQLGGKNLDVVRLDVTSQEDIQEAVRLITGQIGKMGLDGLVNNAGATLAGPLEYLPLDEIRWQMELNLIGPIAVTQAFLPLLFKAEGRIVNMSSNSGRFANPFLGPYAMSKFALEAFSDSLRREMIPWGVEVISVMPGSVATPIWETSLRHAEEIWKNYPPEAQKRYGGIFEKMRERIDDRGTSGMPPQDVVDVIEKALTAKKPRPRYVVGRSTKTRFFLLRFLPDRFFDRMVERALYR